MAHGKFATAINCMDGRTQEPVARWMRPQFGLDYVDMITEPGVDKILSEGDSDSLERIRKKVLISKSAHDSKLVAIVGHYDCAGNPVDREYHLRQIEAGAKRLLSWDLSMRVIGIWVDENWMIQKIFDSEK